MHQRNLTAEFDGPQRIVDVLRRGVDRFGDREMIVTPTDRLTYAEVDRRSRARAKQMIAAGIGKGSRIAVHLPNDAEWIVTFFAAGRVGALLMPFSAAYKPAELRKALQLGDVQLLVASTESWHGGPYTGFLEAALPGIADAGGSGSLAHPAAPFLREVWLTGDDAVPPWVRPLSLEHRDEPAWVSDELLSALEDRVVPADDALVIWTSGTTADPKGAIHTQGTIARRARANAHSHAFTSDDRVFCDFAFWWVGGPGYGFLPAFWVGATVLALPRHDRDQGRAFIEAERATRAAGWAGSASLVTTEGSGHMATPPGIGMTETFGPHSMHAPISAAELRARPPVGLGPAILGFERKLVDPDSGAPVVPGEPGELLVRGPSMMRCLYGKEREEVFDADGWYHTGDRCFIVDDSIHFVSRLNEMIKTSGSNVAPNEVERALIAVPEIEEVAVFGIPDPARGQQVVAAVVPKPGAELDEGEIRERARHDLSNYKVPRQIIILDRHEVPRLHSGKIDKRALAQAAQRRSEDLTVAGD